MNGLRKEIGTPLFENSVKMLLLGGGELGKEVVLEAMRIGVETIVVDRYHNPPAAQVANRSYSVNMLDGNALKAIVYREKPDVIVPEIEAINTDALVELEKEGFFVIPNAKATKITMNRELIRRLAAEDAGVKTSRYEFADNVEEAAEACERIGYPCVMKAKMSSSGLGSSVVKGPEDVEKAYEIAMTKARTRDKRVIVEEFVNFDFEVTEMTLRHYDENGNITTSFCKPIAHKRPGTHYHESWQPAPVSEKVEERIYKTAKAVTDRLGGLGIFGCELFIKGEDVYFNEISPRPHDTSLVTIATQDRSSFALHAHAIIGLPIPSIRLLSPGAAHVILAGEDVNGSWVPNFPNPDKAVAIPGVKILIFGKPVAYPGRRLGMALAIDDDTDKARKKAERAAHLIEEGITYIRK